MEWFEKLVGNRLNMGINLPVDNFLALSTKLEIIHYNLSTGFNLTSC